MGAELKVQAYGEYSRVVEEKLADLLPALERENVSVPPVESLLFVDPATATIIVSIVGTVGPVLVKEIFETIREIVRESYKDKQAHKKPARAVVLHEGKEHTIVTGDEDFGDESS